MALNSLTLEFNLLTQTHPNPACGFVDNSGEAVTPSCIKRGVGQSAASNSPYRAAGPRLSQTCRMPAPFATRPPTVKCDPSDRPSPGGIAGTGRGTGLCGPNKEHAKRKRLGRMCSGLRRKTHHPHRSPKPVLSSGSRQRTEGQVSRKGSLLGRCLWVNDFSGLRVPKGRSRIPA